MLARVCSAAASQIKAWRWRSSPKPPSNASGNFIGSKPFRRLAFFNAWPVLQRELREGSRRPVNHRLRLLSAGVATLLFWIIVANPDASGIQRGFRFLGAFHALILGLIFLVVPALSADCLSREKRDGTLGLLFLTPMSAGDIITGKALALALRAFTLWLAILPLLSIPFLAGGVKWFDALSAVSLEFCAAVLCLTAGLLASSVARERNTAFVLAFSLAAIFLLVFGASFGILLLGLWRGFAFLKQEGIATISVETLFILSGLSSQVSGWSGLAAFSPVLGTIWLRLCLASPLVTLSIFFMVSRFAAARLERSWQDKVPSARRESLIRRYCTPFLRHRFRSKMQRRLDWNPVAWLQVYSWKARLSKWLLCLAFLLAMAAASLLSSDVFDAVLGASLVVLACFYTFAGVNGFLREKRTGALELLLVTPLSASKIIFGRAWGLWTQFLPAALALVGCQALKQWQAREDWDGAVNGVQVEMFVACGFFTLPIFATYFALRVKNLAAGALLTWIALVVPPMFALAFGASAETDRLAIMCPLIIVTNGAFALLTCFLLRHSLSRRIYAF